MKNKKPYSGMIAPSAIQGLGVVQCPLASRKVEAGDAKIRRNRRMRERISQSNNGRGENMSMAVERAGAGIGGNGMRSRQPFGFGVRGWDSEERGSSFWSR